MSTPDSNASKEKKNNKKIQVIIDYFRSPTAIGIYITILFLYISYTFYQVRDQNEDDRRRNNSLRNQIYSVVEWFDLKSMDMRFKMRGEIAPSPKVGLLTVDDRSIVRC